MGKPTEKQAKDMDYLTPPKILEPVKRFFGGVIPLDPATILPLNPTGADFCMTPNYSGLTKSWVAVASGAFVNPPYGRELRQWMEKIGNEASEGLTIVALLPVNRFEQGYFHDSILMRANVVCFIRSRVSFLRPSTGKPAKGNPYASALWGFNTDESKFLAAFGDLGAVVKLSTDIPRVCLACGGEGCMSCSLKESGVTTVTRSLFDEESLPDVVHRDVKPQNVQPPDPALEGFS